MKRCAFLIFAVVVLFITGNAQEKKNLKPDYCSIEKIVKDPNSLFYYPPLYIRYKNNDTTLTRREYRFLYYGFFFHKGYHSSYDKQTEDSLNDVLDEDDLNLRDWQVVIRLVKKCLDKNPFELKKLNLLYFAYKNTGNVYGQRVYKDKIKKIAYTILSSGDGETEETALHVLQVSDEYSLINMLGYKFNGTRELRGDRCDYLALEENSDNIPGLYFDLKQIFIQYEDAMGDVHAAR